MPQSLLFALLLVASGAAWAGRPLLEVRNPGGGSALVLERSEVRVELRGSAPRGKVRLHLSEAAARRWRAALKPGSSLFSAMLAARIRVQGFGLALPPGVLLDAPSARYLHRPMWMWDARRATLTLVLRESKAQPHAPGCAEAQAEDLILWFGELELSPGELLAAEPLRVRGPHDFLALPPACIQAWALSPGAPATLDPQSGLGQVAPDAVDGSTFTLSARVGERLVQGQVRVVDPAQHPLLGLWHQIEEVDCTTGARREASRAMQELRFRGSGQFSATWTPFESYVDYSGTYHFDPTGAELTLLVNAGNDLPPQREIRARARLDEAGHLVVSTLPGGPRHPSDSSMCDMVFARQ